MQRPALTAIPTNIITGFLGAGKTTAILHLLRHRPGDERWAVLVNEFGEIGIDGSLFRGMHNQDSGVFIREVPGGCMCCTAGLPMQIALNQLLARARPHRLLIEPTGLGHPREVLQTLASEHYRDLLSIGNTVTLVDARKLTDSRYTGHETFNQQIAIADVVVGNKQDLYGPEDRERLTNYVGARAAPGTRVGFTTRGAIDPGLLHGQSARTETAYRHQPIQGTPGAGAGLLLQSDRPAAPDKGEGYESIGWRLDGEQVFDYERLFAFLSGLDAERMKAVFITNRGVFGYNLTGDGLTEIALDDSMESLVEVIATEVDPDWEARLMACLQAAH